KSRMKLRSLPAHRRNPDRVLEQPAGVRMVRLGGRQPSQRGPDDIIGQEASDYSGQPGMRDLACKEVEEAVELVGVTAERRSQVGGVRLGCGLERADIDL